MSEAAKYLEISKGRLWYFFSKTVKTGNESLKGYTITKIADSQNNVNRKRKNIEVTDLDTNQVTIYPSFTLASEALGVPQSSLSGYFAKKRTNPFGKKYILRLV
jgi:hypothetical protein